MMEGSRRRGKGRRNKRLKLEDKEDRISDLPDHLLHHILYFLPSTKEAVRTGILSKRWQNQWARVPVLILKYPATIFDEYDEGFVRFIDNILLYHDSSKIKKLHLAYDFTGDSNFSEKIRFASRKHVEELILHCYCFAPHNPCWSPEFVFENSSLIKLEMIDCDFIDDKSINRGSLKALKMEGSTCDMMNANFLSASPSLELLEFNPNGGCGYVITSKSLKTLILSELEFDDCNEISCPNLEELSFKSSLLPDNAIGNVVSRCPLLSKLEVEDVDIEKLVIASKSLRKLVLRDLETCAIEISCPNLEELNCYGPHYGTFELMNTPSLIYAALDFEISEYGECHEDKAKQIFEQLQNVKELTLGSCFIKILSDAELGGLSYRWVNNKFLTLNGPNLEHLPQIVCALHSSPMLERLLINLQVYEHQMTQDLLDLDDSRENCWNLNVTDVHCLPYLKTVEIIGLSKEDAKLKYVLNFIEFLLKNARELEKFVLVISKDCGKDFASTLSKKVSSFPRCSQHAIVKLLCSNN